jgi:hypothetical protein
MSVDLNFFTIKISAKLLNEMEPLDIWEEEIQICTSEVDLLHKWMPSDNLASGCITL